MSLKENGHFCPNKSNIGYVLSTFLKEHCQEGEHIDGAGHTGIGKNRIRAAAITKLEGSLPSVHKAPGSSLRIMHIHHFSTWKLEAGGSAIILGHIASLRPHETLSPYPGVYGQHKRDATAS